MRSFLLLAILSTVICVSVSASAATLYVDGAVSSSGDGASWETALKTIQEGINKATKGDTVVVAEGMYVENLQIWKNLVLTTTDPLDSAVVESTVVDGNKVDSVVIFTGFEDGTCVISGFTLQNGLAMRGGGILGNGTRAAVSNNVVSGNTAYERGGGLCQCNGLVSENVICGNRANEYGGGLYNCNGSVQGNSISANRARYGSGMAYCNALIQTNIITNNFNTSNGYGGGLAYCFGTVEHNLIAANEVQIGGGGLYSCGGTIRNNLIARNIAWSGGGLRDCQGVIQSNTICFNKADWGGGGALSCDCMIANCIIWGNESRDTERRELYESRRPSFSCIRDWTDPTQGNIGEDPVFIDPDGPDDDPLTYQDNDYRLATGSPCIDAGVNEDWMWEGVDLDGNPRILPGNSTWKVDTGGL